MAHRNPVHGVEVSGVINVIPLNDEREYEQSADCWCDPVVDFNESRIVHNSTDCRESVERLIGEGLDGKKWGVFE